MKLFHWRYTYEKETWNLEHITTARYEHDYARLVVRFVNGDSRKIEFRFYSESRTPELFWFFVAMEMWYDIERFNTGFWR